MFKLARLEITGFKSFADPTEIVFTGNGITAVVGPNGCGKSNVSDAISWVLGEQRAKSLRGGEMKDVVFAGTKNRKPGGMAEVVLHMVRDDSVEFSDENELEGIDEALSDIDENFVDMDEVDPQDDVLGDEIVEEAVAEDSVEQIGEVLPDAEASEESVETVKALAVGSAQVVEKKIKTKRHWRPRSFALDFAPGEAVSVTRRLYLSGESEYQLNGKTCRLRDIQDLFAGTGLSGSHYAIIEQGRIGQILSSKPADRRNLIEEAAGISKFRTRQRAAETRLDNARTNLGRVFDIISEVETRVNSLRRQAAKTRRFKILQEEFRVLLRQLYAAEGRHLSELSEQLKVDLGKAELLENELVEQVATKESAARESTAASRNAEESLAELRRIHSVNALERDRAERDHIYKSEQLVGLNARIDVLKGELDAGRQRLGLLAAELERLTAEDKREAEALGVAESDLALAESEHTTALDALHTIEASIDTARAELMQHTAAFERFDEVGRQLTLNIERLEQRISGLDAESRRAEQSFVDFERQAENLASSLASEEKKLESLNNEKDELMAVTAASLEALRVCERDLGELSDEHSAKRHRLATLQELQEKRAVYTPQVQRIFAEQKEIGVKLGGVLADRLQVDERAETAVETLFGDYLQAVIVSSLDEAKKLAAWVRSNEIGRTAMLIVPENNGSQTAAAAAPNSIGGLLGADNELRNALSELFPREFAAELTDDLASGKGGDVQVTPDGELLFGGRMLVTGNGAAGGQNESLLAFKRELTGLESDTARIAKQIETARSKSEAARLTLTENEGKMVDLQSLIIKVDRSVHGMQIQLRSAKDEIDRAQRHRRVVADDIGQTSSEMAELKQKFDDAVTNKTAADASRVETLAMIDEITGKLGGARRIVDEAATVLSEKRLVAATSSERRRSAQSALRRVENEARETNQRVSLQELELNEAESKVRALHASITEITDRIANVDTEVASENDELNAAISALAARRAESDAMSDELADLNRRLGEARNDRALIEIRQAEAVTELKNIAENCQHELNTELAELVSTTEIAEDFVLESARPQANDLRNRLENFGAINMLALEELAEAEERFIFLETQRDDIVNSIAATEEALREIKERSRERFRTAFEAINTNFTEFFQELFGGGQGQMTLLEAEDVLDAGIEVVAQPPGKRLQNIMLLSGGEKAMTAIALVMAIFKYRPSPFCLLDEVDAPLDDANVGRFAAKIAEMSEKTQFIVITHNKRTMESARAMYGVTMQEPGVSKIVSVKFE